MKMYIWDAPLTRSNYSDGCSIAVAETIEDAKRKLIKAFLDDGRSFDLENLERELEAEPIIYEDDDMFYFDGGSA